MNHVTSDGKSTIHKISVAKARALDEWDPESGDPAPLSFKKAITEGKAWMMKKYPKMDDFQVRSITIEKMGWSSLRNRWYYKIEFNPIVGGQKLFGSMFTAVVLLDGSVVEPVVRGDEMH